MHRTDTNTRMSPIFLKLGGSLITDKRSAETPRPDVIRQLAAEIADARRRNPDLRLVIGHGSGSFGHVFGHRYGTRSRRADARTMVRLCRHRQTRPPGSIASSSRALLEAQVPAWSIQPGVALRCEDGRVVAGPRRDRSAGAGAWADAGGLWRRGAGQCARRHHRQHGRDF